MTNEKQTMLTKRTKEFVRHTETGTKFRKNKKLESLLKYINSCVDISHHFFGGKIIPFSLLARLHGPANKNRINLRSKYQSDESIYVYQNVRIMTVC